MQYEEQQTDRFGVVNDIWNSIGGHIFFASKIAI